MDAVDKDLLVFKANERMEGPMRAIDLDDQDRLNRGVVCGFRHEAGAYVAHLTWKRKKKRYEFTLEVFSLSPTESDEETGLPKLNLETSRKFAQEVAA